MTLVITNPKALSNEEWKEIKEIIEGKLEFPDYNCFIDECGEYRDEFNWKDKRIAFVVGASMKDDELIFSSVVEVKRIR